MPIAIVTVPGSTPGINPSGESVVVITDVERYSSEYGVLMFSNSEGETIHLFAPGHWTRVDLQYPSEELEEKDTNNAHIIRAIRLAALSNAR